MSIWSPPPFSVPGSIPSAGEIGRNPTTGKIMRGDGVTVNGVQLADEADLQGLVRGIPRGLANYRQYNTYGAAGAIINADQIVLRDNAGDNITISNAVAQIDSTAVGPAANGRDTATNPSPYEQLYFYFIWNPTTSQLAGICSANPNTPALPAGYTYYSLPLFWAPKDNTANLRNVAGYNGRHVYYGIYDTGPMPQLMSGTGGDPFTAGQWSPVSLQAWIPQRAHRVWGVYGIRGASSGNAMILAPDPGYGVFNDTNKCPLGTNLSSDSRYFEFELNDGYDRQIFYASNCAQAFVQLGGFWMD